VGGFFPYNPPMPSHRRYLFVLFALFVLILMPGCGVAQAPLAPPAGEEETGHRAPRNTVVWISIDGVRPDYIERSGTPLLDRLIREGAYTRRLVPVFPSLTFPAHVSQATGVTVDRHGIPGNSFYDHERGEVLNFPGDAQLLQAEPIWITAARQGVRVASLDWPLSHSQSGEVTTEYFDEAFQRDLNDAQRLQRLIDIWKEDEGEQPLRLLMSYMSWPDTTGHRYGPDSPEVEAAMNGTDAVLQRFFDQMLEIFHERRSDNDTLWFILATDHGMAAVDTLVNLERLLEIDLPRHVRLVTSGNIANIHLDGYDPPQRQEMKHRLLQILRRHDFLLAYPQDELPGDWGYQHPKRVGDIVVALNKGYTFNSRLPLAIYPAEQAGGPYGMHGYPADETDTMLGIAIFWRYPKPLDGVDLGEVHSLQLHATVADLLGIRPADEARRDRVRLWH
jgi:hypothetical protein